MTVIVIVACLVTAGAELFLARGARRVADRLEKLEALTLHQDERMDSMTARLRDAGPVTAVPPDTGPVTAVPPDTAAVRAAGDHADRGLLRIIDETARLRERLSTLEDARRVDRDLCAHLDGAVESLERVVANVFRLTVGELDQAAAGTLRGAPAESGAGREVGSADTVDLGRPDHGGRRSAIGIMMALAAAVSVPLVWGTLAGSGGAVLSQLHRFLTAYGGVLALVASTSSVAAGLVATGRVLLSIRHRILAQAVHRAATLVALVFLTAHVTMMIVTGNAQAFQAVLPLGPAPLAVGTVAAHLLVMVALTGLARGRFAAGRRPGLWRAAHRLAYAGWALAILHGLLAGRRPPTWVTWAYVLCLAGAALALLTRGLVIMRSRGAGERSARSRPRPDRREPDRRETGGREPDGRGPGGRGPDTRRALELRVRPQR